MPVGDLQIGSVNELPTPGVAAIREKLGVNLTTNKHENDLAIGTATQAALDLKADKLNPVLTNPTAAASPAVSDDSLKLATTAMVQDRVAEAVQVAGGAVTLEGLSVNINKYILQITGTLGDGTYPVEFPDLLYAGDNFDRPQYSSLDNNSTVIWNDVQWTLFNESGASWSSIEDVASPDLVETWWPDSPAEGNPIFTFVAHPADFIGQILRVGPYPLVRGRTQPYDWYIAETISPAKWRFMNIS